jgi:hypothetical protein
MAFDVAAARKAGYSEDEILSHLSKTRNYDIDGAKKAGYSASEIVDHLSSAAPKSVDQRKSDITKQYDALANSKDNQGPTNDFSLSGVGDAIGGAVKGAVNTVLHPIDTVKGAVRAQTNEYDRAKAAAGAGDYASAAMHGVASAVPVFGPAAVQAGEDIGSGNVSRGLTNVGLLVGTDAVKGIGKTAGLKVRSGSPLTKGEKIGLEEATLDAAKVTPDASKLINSIDDIRKKNMTANGTVLNQAMENRLTKARDQILTEVTTPNSKSTFKGLADIKRSLQKEANDSGFFDSSDVKDSARAAGEASRAVRSILRDTTGADTWAKLEDSAALGHRIDGWMSKAGATAGAAAGGSGGAVLGGHVGAVAGVPSGAKIGALVGENVSRLITSGKLAKAAAPARNAIADLISSGKFGEAEKVASILIRNGILKDEN